MLTLAIAAALTTQPPVLMPADGWLQARLDHTLEAAGKRPGSVAVSVTRGGDLSFAVDGGMMTVPASALLTARSEAEVDGLLAMMLAYRSSDVGVRRARSPGLASTLAYAGLLAATGGVSDPETGKDSKMIPLGSVGAYPRSAEANPAWRGLAWNAAAGHCTSTIVAFLRRLSVASQPLSPDAQPGGGTALYAKTVLRRLGVLASPSAEACPSDGTNDSAFVEAQLSLSTTSND